jgi:hypothetical protein
MIFPMSLVILLYLNNVMMIYYSFPMLKAFITNSINNSMKPPIDFPIINNFILLIIWSIIFLLFVICNIIYLQRNVRNNNLEIIKKYCKLVKYSLIPFWIINFIAYLGLFLSFSFIMMGWVFLFIPIPIFFNYIILLSTSSYSISYLLLLKKHNIINKNNFIINMILQLCFVLDVIGIIYLNKKYNEKSNVA